MGNLVEIKRDYLFNTLTAKDFGVFVDSDTLKKVLFIRKFGITLLASEKHGFVKSEATAGKAKVALYKLNSKAPSNPSEYEETIVIDPKRKDPGFDELLYLGSKTYGGTYNVSVAAGLISDASKAEIINEIASQIDSDPEAIVTAGYGVLVSNYTAADNIIINGVTFAGATLPVLIAAINAGSLATAHLVPDGSGGTKTDEYVLIWKVKFSSVSSAGGATFGDGYLGVAAKDIDTSFSPKFMNAPDVATDVQRGLFSFLTSDDVRRTFVNNGNDGDLSMFGSADHAIPGELYVKYTVWGHTEAYNNQTPGGTLKHKTQFQLFILKSLIATKFWLADYNKEVVTTATKTIDDLLTFWKG